MNPIEPVQLLPCGCHPFTKPKHHRSTNLVESDRCTEWMHRGNLESRCMDIRGHEEYGYPEHSLDLRGKVAGQYRVMCRYQDAKTPNGHFIPVWRCLDPQGNAVMKSERELVQMKPPEDVGWLPLIPAPKKDEYEDGLDTYPLGFDPKILEEK